MLVLSGRLHEKIVFPGLQTAIEVMAIQPGSVHLGIQAPSEVRVHCEAVSDSASLPQLDQLVAKRLAIARRGLAEMRRHLEAGELADAETILEKIDEDLFLLRRRLRREIDTTGPRTPALYGCVGALSQPN